MPPCLRCFHTPLLPPSLLTPAVIDTTLHAAATDIHAGAVADAYAAADIRTAFEMLVVFYALFYADEDAAVTPARVYATCATARLPMMAFTRYY